MRARVVPARRPADPRTTNSAQVAPINRHVFRASRACARSKFFRVALFGYCRRVPGSGIRSSMSGTTRRWVTYRVAARPRGVLPSVLRDYCHRPEVWAAWTASGASAPERHDWNFRPQVDELWVRSLAPAVIADLRAASEQIAMTREVARIARIWACDLTPPPPPRTQRVAIVAALMDDADARWLARPHGQRLSHRETLRFVGALRAGCRAWGDLAEYDPDLAIALQGP